LFGKKAQVLPKFNIQEFFQNSAHFPSRGRGLFTINGLPEIFKNKSGANIEAEKVLKNGLAARQIQIPNFNILTHQPMAYSGPTITMPAMQIFDDITIEFLLMSNKEKFAGAVYETFNDWISLIAGPEASTTKSNTVRSDSTSFGVSYYRDYVTDATASIYTPSANSMYPAIEALFTELYPLKVGSLSTSWDMDDTPLVLPVTFTYHYCQIKKN